MESHLFPILCQLASILPPEDQLSFLRTLVATTDPKEKNRLAARALKGERVWDAMPAGSALCCGPLERHASRRFHST
jgi:hypothetical protein